MQLGYCITWIKNGKEHKFISADYHEIDEKEAKLRKQHCSHIKVCQCLF